MALDSWLKTQSKEIQDKYKASASTVSQPSGTYKADGTYEAPKPSSGSGGTSTQSYDYKPYKAPSYNPISYSEAQSRAQGQIDPIYTRALENVRASIQPSKLDADQVAAARGGLHSGLAADLQNKVQINANSKMADLQGDQASKIAQLAQAMVDQDFNQQQSIQQNAFQQWLASQNFDFGVFQNQQNNTRADSQFEFDKWLQQNMLFPDRVYLDGWE